MLNDAIKTELNGKGGLYYINKKEASKISALTGVQFPGITNIPDGFIRSIHDFLSKVNTKYKNVTETLIEHLKEFIEKIRNALRKMDAKARSEASQLVKYCDEKQKLYDKVLREALENSYKAVGENEAADFDDNVKTNDKGNNGKRYELRGIAADGRKIYEANFPKGTPKAAKSEAILGYITNVWSKKPISLVISNGKTSRTILAHFDPTMDENAITPTDASKIAGGNRHGSGSEKRVTLDLGKDYYEIASDSTYNYSKLETGKSLETHKDVKMWHYFINEIYFAEYGEEEYAPYTITINVKEKDNGDFVYSFNAEKEFSTRQTLHADVNTRKGINGELFLENDTTSSAESQSQNKNFQKKPAAEIDREYLSLTKDPVKNEAKLRATVEKAARAAGAYTENGRAKVMYHQTKEDFTIFDIGREGAGTRDNETPFGIFLKSTGRDIGLKGKKQMALYVRAQAPLTVQNRSELVAKLKSMSP